MRISLLRMVTALFAHQYSTMVSNYDSKTLRRQIHRYNRRKLFKIHAHFKKRITKQLRKSKAHELINSGFMRCIND